MGRSQRLDYFYSSRQTYGPAPFKRNLMSKNSFLIFVVVLVSSLHVMSQNVWGQGKPVKVEVVKSGSGYQLFRGGQPYFIKGAGGSSYMSRVAAYGGNSIRTWGTRDGEKVLDSARKYGLTVLMGLG